MGNLSEHFSKKEFACPHCGKAPMDKDFVLNLEALSDLTLTTYGKRSSIYILSGYRCPDHNAQIGGASASMHQAGLAADIQIAGLTAKQTLELVEKLDKFTGHGFYVEEHFVHVDNRPGGHATWGRLTRAGPYVSLKVAKDEWERLYGNKESKT